ncbi:MAG: 23S rRNA pseudouridine(2604) synthase RluF [Saprospiraceae bacterium]
MPEHNQNSISLNKYISDHGICSRREATKMIADGRVTINEKPTKPGNRVAQNDVVKIDGKKLKTRPNTIYIAFNKPVGIVCTTDMKEKKNIISYINHKERLFPIGRLDKPSQGLIFLTNDGNIVNKILRAGNNHEKTYRVAVDRYVDDQFLSKMSNGIPILGTITKKCKVRQLSESSFEIILTQGLNRQIRRMCEYLGYNVTKLKRTQIMNVSLGKLKIGQSRALTSKEMSEINHMIGSSSKTKEASFDKGRKKGYSARKKKY